MIRYKLYKNTNEKSAQFGKWYARASATNNVDLDGLAAHMATHNSPYSKGVIRGVLTDMITCIKELVLDGKGVKLDDLAIFSVGIKTTPADSPSEFTAKDNVTGYRLRARATGDLSPSSFKLDVQLKEADSYDVDKDE